MVRNAVSIFGPSESSTRSKQGTGYLFLYHGPVQPPDGVEGALTFVSLDGDPAVLVVGPVRDGEQQVRALACGDGRVVAETEVPPAG